MQDVFQQFRHTTLDEFVVRDPSHEQAVDVVRYYTDHLDEAREQGRGLTFLGPNGVGKTRLASEVLKKAHEEGYRIESVEMSTYVGMVKEVFELRDLIRGGYDDAIGRFAKMKHHVRFIEGQLTKSADWVLLDDIGREYQSDSGWSNRQVFDMLRFRYNRKLPFIVTTNLPLSELAERYDDGMPSLLQEATTVVAIGGDDYRYQIAIRREMERWNEGN